MLAPAATAAAAAIATAAAANTHIYRMLDELYLRMQRACSRELRAIERLGAGARARHAVERSARRIVACATSCLHLLLEIVHCPQS